MYSIFIKHLPAEISKNVEIIKINIVTIFLIEKVKLYSMLLKQGSYFPSKSDT